MLKREYKNTGDQISVLGLGCMRLPKVEGSEKIDRAEAQKIVDLAYERGVNYFDTAYRYHEGDSELFIGEALKKYPRESFHLATKMPMWMVKSPEDVKRIFEDQLSRCQVEYFDFYLCHAMNATYFETMKKHGVYEYLLEEKKAGRIRHLGFSFHDSPEVLRQIVEYGEWDFAQIKLNYLDWELQDAKSQYEILTEHGIPVVVMEPVRGGALASLCEESDRILKEARPDHSIASWAVRYVASLPNVMTVLSGMSTVQQVEDNTATMIDFEPLTDKDREVIAAALEAYRKNKTIPCTGCRYCMDCPFGVDIPGVFKAYNTFAIGGGKDRMRNEIAAFGEGHGPDQCKSCGKCMKLCPQKIQIPDRMKEIAELLAQK